MSSMTWFITALACFILEAAAPGIFIICFAFGALATGLLSLAVHTVPLQLVIFAASSFLSVLILRPLLYGKEGRKELTNTARMIGREGYVTIRIPREMHGFIKLGSEIWMATADEEIEKGAKVRVLSVSGATLTVERAASPSAASHCNGQEKDKEDSLC